jgi:hypothetical protein
MMEAFSIKFDGHVLDRGFWLYIVDINAPEGRCLYVGRTGDSSSANASSPFSRIGQHLDARPQAKGNALARNLRKAGIVPRDCKFEMIAVGPIFPEEKEFTAHRPVRDQAAALEKALAATLRERGYRVLGNHAGKSLRDEGDRGKLDEVVRLIDARIRRETR